MSINKKDTILGGIDTVFLALSSNNFATLPLPDGLVGAGVYVIRIKSQNNVEGIYLVSVENDHPVEFYITIVINSNVFPAAATRNQMLVTPIDPGTPIIQMNLIGSNGTWAARKNGGGNNPVSFNFKKIDAIFN